VFGVVSMMLRIYGSFSVGASMMVSSPYLQSKVMEVLTRSFVGSLLLGGRSSSRSVGWSLCRPKLWW
jgi:hypothetical protein